MGKTCRYKNVSMNTLKFGLAVFLIFTVLTGCGKAAGKEASAVAEGARDESATDSHVDFEKLKEANSDIFAWLYLPDTEIDYPVVQNSEGDDSFYLTHNVYRQEDPKGAIHIEAANLKDMCDFNEVLLGSAPEDGTMFAGLNKFLDRAYFEDHKYIYVYTEGNALIYYVFAAYSREDKKLLQQYDFSYAKGCREFLDEIFSSKTMNRNIRSGWERAVEVENFLITLSTRNNDDPSKQTVVIGCLVGDVRGEIDRYIDYSDPEDE
ncbi:class B sortase [Butyrivibrio sp. FCS014]|uniref:class B sortase n=1 Tax=Butyrivibrio sp. FCS014 TaxID=1408304 RepID=UPI0018CC113A|nr:class B sortase [Butyrivibrio sp. FCS014]